MFYNAHEREYRRILVELEPSPEFLARCLRAQSLHGASTSDIPCPRSDEPSAIGGTRHFP